MLLSLYNVATLHGTHTCQLHAGCAILAGVIWFLLLLVALKRVSHT
jgi:hypothetical protein